MFEHPRSEFKFPRGHVRSNYAIGYDEYGQRIRMDLGNGAKTVYTYDPARRWLKEALTTDSMNTVLQDLTYTFDASGDVTTLNNAGAKKTTVQNYSYDALDQLTAANGSYQNNTYSLGTKTSYAQSFAYDTIGNLTAKISTLNRTPATTQDGQLNYSLNYTYDTNHPHQAAHIGTDHYVYDLNGNLTKIIPDWAWTGENTDPKTVIVTTQSTGRDIMNQAIGEDRSTTVTTSQTGSRFLTWDWENRLRAYKDDQTTVMYDYDADGERRLKSIGTSETIYADRMYEVENGSARQLGTVNVYLGDTRLVSKVVPLNSPSTGYELQNVYYYHSDHIGNSTLITDYLAREYERDAFTPHGELWQQDSLDTLDKIDVLFTGKQVDAETGWYNFGKRYLDPKTGLWLSADPALGEYLPNAPLTDEDKKHNQSLPGNGGIYNPVNFALYHFAGNNPIRYTDPDGKIIIGGLLLLFDPEDTLDPTIDAVSAADDGLRSVGLDLNALMGAGKEIEAGVGGLKYLSMLSKLARAESVWKLDNFARGWAIEKGLGGMLNNFPVIDKFTEAGKGLMDSVTSIKSLDLAAKSYQRSGAVLNKIGEYVKSLANFTGTTYKGVGYTVLPGAVKTLELAIPRG